MRILTAILLALFASVLLRADAGDIAAVSRSVVRVAVFSDAEGQRTFIGHGSGVAVAPDKIVTNSHVVADAEYDQSATFRVVPSQGSGSYEAKLIATLPGKDLALLQIVGGRLPPATLYSGPVSDGADVIAIGYPANVDVALETSDDDKLNPQIPVKTHGSISAGRTSKSVDSILHTAPIAPGNSGGPLVDACGRVVGINSFGALAQEGGAEFYFAISTREVDDFLRAQKVAFTAIATPCRSAAELSAAEAEHEAANRAKIEAAAREATEKRALAEGKARRDAQYAVIGARENHMALSAFLLVLALGAAGAAWQFHERAQRDRFKLAAGAGGAMLFAAIVIFAARPSFDRVEERVTAVLGSNIAPGATPPAKVEASKTAARKICVIQLDRSRITVSKTDDVAFSWDDKGCVNGRTQYAENGDRWTRTLVPGSDEAVSVISYSPHDSSYRVERYLLGIDAMAKARDARNRYAVNGCAADESIRNKVDAMNKAVRAVLPATANETLLFDCRDTK